MFQNDNNPLSRFSIPLFWVQVFLAPLGSLVGGLVLAALIDVTLRTVLSGAPPTEDIISYLVFGSVGLATGYGVQIAIPAAIESGGRWVWIPPFGLVVWALVVELGKDPSGATSALFLTDPQRPLQGLPIVLLTCPALGAFCYSVGICLAGLRTRNLPAD